jgi:hypothetical protein
MLREYDGLVALLRALHAALEPAGRCVTLAYYPDGIQESLLASHGGTGVFPFVELAHAMAYDGTGADGQHSSRELAVRTLEQARAAGLPLGQLVLGLPFYGRDARTGEWQSYEDLVQRHWPLPPDADGVRESRGSGSGQETWLVHFNGPRIQRAAHDCLEAGARTQRRLWRRDDLGGGAGLPHATRRAQGRSSARPHVPGRRRRGLAACRDQSDSRGRRAGSEATGP